MIRPLDGNLFTLIDGASTPATIDGTPGDDVLVGTDNGDIFHLEAGGDDTAKGFSGSDVFYMGAAFTAADHIDGGSGGHIYPRMDTIVLDGDYSAGLKLKAHSLSHVEQMTLIAGHDYDITLNAEPSGGTFTVIGSLGSTDHMRIDGSHVVDGLVIQGGQGTDLLIGSAVHGSDISGGGADTMIGGASNDRFTASSALASISAGDGADIVQINGDMGAQSAIDAGDGDDQIAIMGALSWGSVVDGGAGDDQLSFTGRNSTLSSRYITNIETFMLSGTATARDGLADGGNRLFVEGAYALHFDGSAETQDAFTLIGGSGNDTLIGGGGADEIRAGSGDNTLIGGEGADTLVSNGGYDKLAGGAGADTLIGSYLGCRFFFLDASDSTAAQPDRIEGLFDTCMISLKAIDADDKHAGNQAFRLVDAFTHHRGELVLSYDADTDITSVGGDVNGDGVADLVINIVGDHTSFTQFEL